MTDPTVTKVLDKVRKLLALSTSPNEAEALSAAAKAQSLLTEHRLSMADVKSAEAIDKKPLNFTIDNVDRTDSRPWRRGMATQCAKLYFCKYFFQFDKEPAPQRGCGYIRYDLHYFAGEEHNVLVAKMLFTYLTATGHRLATEGMMQQPVRKRTSYRDGFLQGFGQRIAYRLHERVELAKAGGLKSETGNTLPVPVGMYEKIEADLTAFLKAERGRDLAIHRRRSGSSNTQGKLDGRAAADRVGLDQQVGRAEGRKQLT